MIQTTPDSWYMFLVQKVILHEFIQSSACAEHTVICQFTDPALGISKSESVLPHPCCYLPEFVQNFCSQSERQSQTDRESAVCITSTIVRCDNKCNYLLMKLNKNITDKENEKNNQVQHKI